MEHILTLEVPKKLLKFIRSMIEIDPSERRRNALSGKASNILKNEYSKYIKMYANKDENNENDKEVDHNTKTIFKLAMYKR